MTTDNTDNTDKNNGIQGTGFRGSDLIFKDESYAIRGAIFEVYNQVGCGFLEGVYQECLSKEFLLRAIPFVAQAELKITYKGDVLAMTYRPDFVCYGEIVLEIKAVKELTNEHRAQLLNYLKASRKRLGFLANFGSSPRVIIERMLL